MVRKLYEVEFSRDARCQRLPNPRDDGLLQQKVGGEDVPHVRYNGQHGSTAQLPSIPSGLSRVIGYLPRTTCGSLTPFVAPTGLDMPSQKSLSSSDGDWMGNSGPYCRSSSVPSLAFHRSLSSRPLDSTLINMARSPRFSYE